MICDWNAQGEQIHLAVTWWKISNFYPVGSRFSSSDEFPDNGQNDNKQQ